MTHFLSLLDQCEDPEKYIINGNKSSVSAWSSQPVIQGDITPVTDDHNEMYHVPFLLRMPKDYHRYRLPGHNFTVNMDEVIPQSLTKKLNGNISVESHRHPTSSNVSMEREAILADENSSMATIDNSSWLVEKLRNVTRVENDGKVLVEKVSGANCLARFYGNTTRIAPTNSIWQEIFEIIVMYWMLDIGVTNLNCTACFIKGIIWLLR